MKRRLHRKDKKQQKIIISLSVFLVIFLSVGYAAFQTNISLKAKGNIKEKTISISDLIKTVVTTGDGLYSDSTETGRYVYRGANPNNYITLGTDIYRIISIESDGTLKVIKNGNIGYIVFDPGYSTSISGVTDTNSVVGTRYSNTSADYCYQNSGAESSYHGCNVWGSKTTMLDSSGNNVAAMPREVGGTSYNLPDAEAYINTYLNSTWLNTLPIDVQNKIVTHMFNVGIVNVTDGQTLATDISQEQAYKWKGKVGLTNASDYVKASTNSACTSIIIYSTDSNCYNNSQAHNWIFSSALRSHYSWIITPLNSKYGNNNYSALVDSDTSQFSFSNSKNPLGVVPVFYLSSDITLKGEGTTTTPYTIM